MYNLSEYFRKGRLVRYENGPADRLHGKVGVVAYVNRSMVYVYFGSEAYGCYLPFLHPVTSVERKAWKAAHAVEATP